MEFQVGDIVERVKPSYDGCNRYGIIGHHYRVIKIDDEWHIKIEHVDSGEVIGPGCNSAAFILVTTSNIPEPDDSDLI